MNLAPIRNNILIFLTARVQSQWIPNVIGTIIQLFSIHVLNPSETRAHHLLIFFNPCTQFERIQGSSGPQFSFSKLYVNIKIIFQNLIVQFSVKLIDCLALKISTNKNICFFLHVYSIMQQFRGAPSRIVFWRPLP